MAMKHGIDVMAGVIDEDYTGEVMVLLINFGADAMVIHPGERIAQLILEKIESVDLTVVTELPATLRAEGGFGSSGI
jgi:dUTP pyrophosphatase